MCNAMEQHFTCETVEDSDRFTEVTVCCRVIIDAFGVKIDSVKQLRIREAIRRAIEDAVTVIEAPAEKEADNA